VNSRNLPCDRFSEVTPPVRFLLTGPATAHILPAGPTHKANYPVAVREPGEGIDPSEVGVGLPAGGSQYNPSSGCALLPGRGPLRGSGLLSATMSSGSGVRVAVPRPFAWASIIEGSGAAYGVDSLPKIHPPRGPLLCSPTVLLLLFYLKLLISLTGYSNTSRLCWCVVGVVPGK
jgi:hypothetical protein